MTNLPRPEDPPLLNVLAGLCFAGFVAAGIWTFGGFDSPERHRRRVSVFILYGLAASFGSGLTQRDLFPFASWQLIAARVPPVLTYPRLVGVDGAGIEHPIDNRAWQPLSDDDLLAWFNRDFLMLDAAGRDQVARYLLDTVNGGRARALETGRPGYFDRFLGPLAAPPFVLHPRLWSDPARIPGPLAGIRFYRETWDLEGRGPG